MTHEPSFVDAGAQPAGRAHRCFDRLVVEADRVRWRMTDIPWHDFDRAKVTDSWVELVREIVTSELPTFSGAGRFLEQFKDDFDFTQWVTMWQFEETRHPHVLIRWLDLCGSDFDLAAALAARETHPLVESKIATLTLNIISEMMASAGYMALFRNAREPVLKIIARNLAADEARHASGFFTYAQRALNASSNRRRDRATVLRILYLWMRRSEGVKHPLALLHQRVLGREDLARYAKPMEFQSQDLRDKICKMIGTLVEMPLESHREILDCLAAVS
jgi:hypothetical protein